MMRKERINIKNKDDSIINNKIKELRATAQASAEKIKYLTYVEKVKNSTRKDAIAFLHKKHAIVHMTAHKIVEDEQSGKIDPVELKR